MKVQLISEVEKQTATTELDDLLKAAQLLYRCGRREAMKRVLVRFPQLAKQGHAGARPSDTSTGPIKPIGIADLESNAEVRCEEQKSASAA